MSFDNINTYVQTLHGDHARALKEQRDVLDKAVKERRELSGEEKAIVERTDKAMDEAMESIDGWLARGKKQRDQESALGELEPFVKPDARADANRADQELDRTIEAFLRGETRGSDLEKGKPGLNIDLIPAARAMTLARAGGGRPEFRDLTIVTAAAGGTLVPTTFSLKLLQAMETLGGPIECGCEVLDTAGGESFVYLTEATAGTAAIVGEGSAIAEADPTFGRVTLGAWKYAELIQPSTELVTDVGIDLVSYVARMAGKALARVTTTAFTTGSGSNAPQGYITGSGNGGTAQTTSTGVPKYEDLVDLAYNVTDEAYAGPRSVFVTRFANVAALRKIKDGAGNYVWERSMAVGQPASLLGYALRTNPNHRAWATAAGTGTISFGDFEEGYVLRRVAAVRFERSDDFAFANDLVSFRAITRVDGKVKQAGAIRSLREPTT